MDALSPTPLPSVYIATYGCQMNVLDSQLVRGQLQGLGYHFVDDVAEAGIALINTCSVRALSEQKVWSQLGRLGVRRAQGQKLIVGVLGCMAEREGAEFFRRMPHVALVCGPSQLDQLPEMLLNARLNQPAQLRIAGHRSRRSSTLEAAQDGVETLDLSRAMSPTDNRFQAYVRITRGCNKFCAFCVVPFVRGPEVHRPPAAIIAEVRRLVAAGAREVTLLGQTVNHYVFRDGNRTTSFADLLWAVHEAVPELPRLRFLTSYPRDFGDDALDVMAAAPRICRYLHIPAQSGSDSLLKRMNRGYQVDAYLALLERARARMPDIALSGDMIVGFSGETDADQEASIALLRAARYKSCFIFKYSPRPNTVAARRLADDVPEATKKVRNLELLAVQHEISRVHLEGHLGRVLQVLVEGPSKLQLAGRPPPPAAAGAVRLGWQQSAAPVALPPLAADWIRLVGRTGGDEIVVFDGPPHLAGQLVPIEAVSATPLTITGRWRSAAHPSAA